MPLIIFVICMILIFLSIIVVIVWIMERRRVVKIINKIPGPKTTPIVGNIDVILCSPEQLWLNLRRLSKLHYPIYKLWACHVPAVFMVSPEDVEILISSTKNMDKSNMYYCLQGWLGTGLLTSTGKKWQSRRKMLTPSFHFNILKQFLPVFAEQSDVLVDQLVMECDKPYTNIVPYISKFTLNSICETAMGIDSVVLGNNDEGYTHSIYKMGKYVVYRIIRPWLYTNVAFFFTKTFWQQRSLTKKLQTFSLGVIQQRKCSSPEGSSLVLGEYTESLPKNKRLAMLDLLIAAKNLGYDIDDGGIREEVDTFMFEGHDTTTMCISYTLMLLACHQDIQERVNKEVKETIRDSKGVYSYDTLKQLGYLEMVLKESLRMYPSVPLISRVTSEDICTHSGYTIPVNTPVNVLIYDMHHNPKYYPNPHKFDPDRFLPENTLHRHPFAYIPFSGGPRNCIGQKFAFLELKMVISKIVQNFKLYPVDTPATITLTTDLLLRTTNGIKIKFKRRNVL